MTIAEIKGKISGRGTNISDRLEDLLTSDVFSACKYVNPDTLLIPFLNQAKDIKNNVFSELSDEVVTKVHYLFWPQLHGLEPDVLIALELQQKKAFLLLIEAKYFSSKSSEAWSDEELVEAKSPKDQLAKEYKAMLSEETLKKFSISCHGSYIKGKALIYITAHRSMPIDSIEESIKEAKKFVNTKEVNIFWLSWFDLYPIVVAQAKKCKEYEFPILEDLRCLLERKHLVKFKGFNLEQINPIVQGDIYLRRYKFVNIKEDIMHKPAFYTQKKGG